MNVWRYQIRESLWIDAPVAHVYARASDPEIVPSYAPEIARIEVVRRLGKHLFLVKSYLKVAGLTFGFLYRYHYGPPVHYSGVQERGGLLRGYFTLSFRACGRGSDGRTEFSPRLLQALSAKRSAAPPTSRGRHVECRALVIYDRLIN